jgi:uncharacterized protein (DUF433 family)
MTFERITIDSAKMGGVACIRGLRIPVVTCGGYGRGGDER